MDFGSNQGFLVDEDSNIIQRCLSGSTPEEMSDSNCTSASSTPNTMGDAMSQSIDMQTSYSNCNNRIKFSKIVKGIIRSKEGLDETLNCLIGLHKNTIKPCSKLRAASFVLAYTIHDMIGNASKIFNNLDEIHLTKSQFNQTIYKLHALSLELQHFLKDAQIYLEDANKFNKFCCKFLALRRANSSGYVGRGHLSETTPCSISNENDTFCIEPVDILWLLFVKEDTNECKNINNNNPCNFSKLDKTCKIEFTDCLIARYRLLVATAHSSLKSSKNIFNNEMNTDVFFNFSIQRLFEEELFGDKLFYNASYRELIRKILPVTRSLMSLNTSIAEITIDAKNVINLTENFLSKMKISLFRRNYISILMLHCFDIFKTPASVIWNEIELKLQHFATLLGIDTMAIMMERGSLLLRKSSLISPVIIPSNYHTEQNNISNDDKFDLNENEVIPVDEIIEQTPDVLSWTGFEPPIMLSDPLPSIITREPFDLEVNLPETTREDIENNNFNGPTLIYVDYSECPESPSPLESNFSNTSISSNNNIKYDQEQFPTAFISFYTINFLLLLYNWFSKYYPQNLIKINEKIKPNILEATINMNKLNNEKDKKEVVLHEPPEQKQIQIARASNLIAEYRRKSSVPFANRTPKVRFNRVETCITSTKPGPYKPIVPGTPSEEDLLKMIHSILKETEHPILIDLTLLSFQNLTGNSLSNDEMLLCTAMVEWQCKSFAKADRQGRGAMDILSFPTAGERVETASRIRACLMMTIDLMNKLTGDIHLLDPEINEIITEVSKIMTTLVNKNEEIMLTGKEFLKCSQIIHDKWHDLLIKKSEFQLEHSKINTPMYKQSMPENITLYEDNVNSPCPDYLSHDGTLTFFWNTNNMTIQCETDKTIIKINKCTHIEKLRVLITILRHIEDLIHCANEQLKVALEVFDEPILQTGFDNIKSRVIGMHFDTNFDPLCALDLKNTLCELSQRSCELLNSAEKIYNVLLLISKIIKLLEQFKKQFHQGIKMKNKKFKWFSCCCPSNYVWFEDISKLLGRMSISDLLLTIPMPKSFEMPKNIHFSNALGQDISGDDDDYEDDEMVDATSTNSTVYHLLQSSEAELRL